MGIEGGVVDMRLSQQPQQRQQNGYFGLQQEYVLIGRRPRPRRPRR